MKKRLIKFAVLFSCICAVGFAFAPPSSGQNQAPDAPRVAWYATLEGGLAEAERSNRPILFTAGAPQCLGVSGIW